MTLKSPPQPDTAAYAIDSNRTTRTRVVLLLSLCSAVRQFLRYSPRYARFTASLESSCAPVPCSVISPVSRT